MSFPSDKKAYFRSGIKGTSDCVAKSALQKYIRRNRPEEACYWAAYLLASQKLKNLWNRLLIIAAEDIGPADLRALQLVACAYEKVEKLRSAHYSKPREWMEMRNNLEVRSLLHVCVSLFCGCEKSRMLDHSCVAILDPIVKRGSRAFTSDTCLADALKGDDFVFALRCFGRDLRDLGDKAVTKSLADVLKAKSLKIRDFGKSALYALSATTKPSLLHYGQLVWIIMHGDRVPYDSFTPTELAEQLVFKEGGASVDPRAIYVELVDPKAVARTYDRFVEDMHVRGYTPGCVQKFVEDEQIGLSPSSKNVPDVIWEKYKLELHEGVLAREEEMREKRSAGRKRKANEEKTPKKRAKIGK